MKKIIYIVFLQLLLLSCGKDVQILDEPDDLIEQARMTDILYDVTLLNAMRSSAITKLKDSGVKPETYIYEKYGIDSLQFAESLAYYTVQFSTYIGMLDEIDARIKIRKKELINQKKVDDSISAAKREEQEAEKSRIFDITRAAKLRDSLRGKNKSTN